MSALATSLPTPRTDGKPHGKYVWIIATSVLLLLAIVSSILLWTHSRSSGSSITPEAYRKELQSQVQTANGAPINGRDPADQVQTSLASAANAQDVIGKRVLKPAAKIVGTVRHTDPTSVLPDTKKTHVLASGCLLGYGVPGVQCVPAKAPNNQPLNCNFIRTVFPNGVKILGTDYLNLGQGSDMACANSVAASSSTTK